jgi:hypothetical protein
MKNKLAFHADKMKLVCILEAISQGLCVIWIIFRVMAAEKKMEDYSQLIITSIFSFVPLILSVFILEYGKRGAKVDSLIRIYALVSAALNMSSIISRINFCNESAIGFSAIIDYLVVDVMCLASWILIAVFWKHRALFVASGVVVILGLFFSVFRSILSLILFFMHFDVLNNFEVTKYSVYAILFGLIQACIDVVCAIILLFFVFSKGRDNLEEKLEKLHEDYTSGKITKDSYDAQREELLKEI